MQIKAVTHTISLNADDASWQSLPENIKEEVRTMVGRILSDACFKIHECMEQRNIGVLVEGAEVEME